MNTTSSLPCQEATTPCGNNAVTTAAREAGPVAARPRCSPERVPEKANTFFVRLVPATAVFYAEVDGEA